MSKQWVKQVNPDCVWKREILLTCGCRVGECVGESFIKIVFEKLIKVEE